MSRHQVARAMMVVLLMMALFLTGRAASGYAWSEKGSQVHNQSAETASAGSIPISTNATATPVPDENAVTQISKQLYCPLCTGVRLDNCDLPLCDQMREVIRQRLAAGEMQDEITAYFVEQYGQVVLGVPPKRGGMVLAWVVPFVVVLVAGGYVYNTFRLQVRRPDGAEAEDAAPQTLPARYEARLERELERFE